MSENKNKYKSGAGLDNILEKILTEVNEEEEILEKRFPDPPPSPKLPEVPKISVQLPPDPTKSQVGKVEPGGHGKIAIAFTAASSFITPIIVLSLGGQWLDNKMKNTTPWITIIGFFLGFTTGMLSLFQVIKKLEK